MADEYQPLEPAERLARDRRVLVVSLEHLPDEVGLFGRIHPIRESRMISVRRARKNLLATGECLEDF